VYSDSFWLITSAATIRSVRVLQYDADHFQAVGCISKQIEKITTEGLLIESLPIYDFRGVYVFVRESGIWKLSGFFNTTDPNKALKDWDYAPEWLKQILGDLPSLIDKNC
jgi:hypothetical protein